MRRKAHLRRAAGLLALPLLAFLTACAGSDRSGVAGSVVQTPAQSRDAHACTVDCLIQSNPLLPPLPADYSAPGSPTAIVACYSREHPPAPEVLRDLEEQLFGIALQYQLDSRWSTTASGPTGGPGNPVTITWSFVPDGLTIVGGVGGDGASVLFQRMDTLFNGNRALWIQRFVDAFARWSQVTGNQYIRIREPFGNDWDDGAAWGTLGFLARRGDIRIGMKTVDGPNGILAYDGFPNQGDMVLDVAENWADPASNHRFMRNIIAHENGHGMGLRHVCPPDGTKVMEPFLSTAFDGPQQDDIRAMQRHYGDHQEGDNTALIAFDLGSFGPSVSRTFGDVPTSLPSVPNAISMPALTNASTLSLDADGEEDWSAINLTRPLLVTATVRPIGTAYATQPQDGDNCPDGALVSALNRANLRLQIFEQLGITPIVVADVNPQAQPETLTQILLPTGRNLIRVTESNAPTETQLYKLDISTGAALNFTASDAQFDDRVALSWSPVPNRTTYQIFRGTTNVRVAATQIGATTNTTFSDTTATRGPVFYYWVQTSQTASSDYLVDFGGPEQGSRRRPPCPADFNQDGSLDPDDLGDFINCYFSTPRCGQSNFNGDGGTDPDDLGDFINAYFLGCP